MMVQGNSVFSQLLSLRELDRELTRASKDTWGDNSCVTASAVANVSFNAFPDDNPCDQLGYTIEEGVPPYSVTIVNP